LDSHFLFHEATCNSEASDDEGEIYFIASDLATSIIYREHTAVDWESNISCDAGNNLLTKSSKRSDSSSCPLDGDNSDVSKHLGC
jgi:hypothetical protein